MFPIIATTFRPGASPLPGGAASTVPAASMPGTRGKLTPSLTPSRSFSSERLRPNASTRMRTQPSRSGGSGSVVRCRLSTGPGAESWTARMVAGEDVMGLPSSRVAESVGDGQQEAAAASFPTPDRSQAAAANQVLLTRFRALYCPAPIRQRGGAGICWATFLGC